MHTPITLYGFCHDPITSFREGDMFPTLPGVLYVLILVQGLDDDDFNKREAAQQKLERVVDYKYYKFLAELKVGQPLEARRRINDVCEKYESKLKSEYVIDLHGYKGYPQLDEGWIHPKDGFIPLKGPWKDWDKWDVIHHFLGKVTTKCYPAGNSPHYSDLREACQAFWNEYQEWQFRDTLEHAKNEKDFRERMSEYQKHNQQIMDKLLEGDRYWYSHKMEGKYPNPYEK